MCVYFLPVFIPFLVWWAELEERDTPSYPVSCILAGPGPLGLRNPLYFAFLTPLASFPSRYIMTSRLYYPTMSEFKYNIKTCM